METDVAQLLAEDRISFNELAHRHGVNPSTVWRWATRGVRGIILESVAIGRKRLTTEQAFERWVAALNGEPKTPPPTLPTTVPMRVSKKRIAAARAEMKRVGVVK